MQKLRPLTLRRNFSWTFAGNIVYAACQWGMLTILTKLGSPEVVGQFTLGLAVTAPVFMFTNLQLRGVQATDAKQQYQFSDYLNLRLLSTGLALAIIVLITLAVGYRWETQLVILIIAIAKAFESVSDIFYGLLQQYERMDRIAVSLMIRGPLSLILLGAGVYLTKNLLWGVIGLAVAWAIVLLTYDVRSRNLVYSVAAWKDKEHGFALDSQPSSSSMNQKSKDLNSRWSRGHLKTLGSLIWLSLPLGFVMMFNSLTGNIPQYMIERYLGERALGIFSAIAYLMVAGNLVVNALGQSATPRLAKYYATGNSKAFSKLLFQVLGIGVLLGTAVILVALIAGKPLLSILYHPEYAEYANLFVLLMIVAGVNYVSSFLGYGMTAIRYFRVQIPLFTLVATVSTLACLWLIPIYGLQGAAGAFLLAAIVQVAISSLVIMYGLSKLSRDSRTAL
jgi:O-antigen/teichoic acid export membrane protein